jgi:hypothetical protein
MNFESLLSRAEMMLTFGMEKDDVSQRLERDGENKDLIYFALIGASLLIKWRNAE